MPDLFPAVLPRIDTPPTWLNLPERPWPEWVALSGAATGDKIALVVATLASYNTEPLSQQAMSVQALTTASDLVLPGGLVAVEGEVTVVPGCCAGLETWREWTGLLAGGGTPWLGHDPDAWVEAKEDEFIVWSDLPAEASSNTAVSVKFSREELERALGTVQADLAAFSDALEVWSSPSAPHAGRLLAPVFRRHFDVPRGAA